MPHRAKLRILNISGRKPLFKNYPRWIFKMKGTFIFYLPYSEKKINDRFQVSGKKKRVVAEFLLTIVPKVRALYYVYKLLARVVQ